MTLGDKLKFIQEHTVVDTSDEINNARAESTISFSESVLNCSITQSILRTNEGLGNGGYYAIDTKSIPADWGSRVKDIKINDLNKIVVYERLAIVLQQSEDDKDLKRITWFSKLFDNQFKILEKYELRSSESIQLISEDNISDNAVIGGFNFTRIPEHIVSLDKTVKFIDR